MIDFEEGKQLIKDALDEFYPEEPWQKYISEEDIKRFLRGCDLIGSEDKTIADNMRDYWKCKASGQVDYMG